MIDTLCTHHWFIDLPDEDGRQLGVCRKCDEVKEYRNIFDYQAWTWDEPGEHYRYSLKDHEKAEMRTRRVWLG